MKKRWMVLIAMFLLFCSTGNVGATLISINSGVLYDNTNDQYWYQDLKYFTSQTYDQQIVTIGALNDSSSGYTSSLWGDWHLADYSEMQELFSYDSSEITKFTKTYSSTGAAYFDYEWFGRYERVNSATSHYAGYLEIKHTGVNNYTLDVTQIDAGDVYWLGAWVTADPSVPIPEPTTALLFGLGILGIAGISRRKKWYKI